MEPPTLHDIYDARPRVYKHLRPTPLLAHPLLKSEIGTSVYVKHENHNPTGAFKIRGGLNLVATLAELEAELSGSALSARRGEFLDSLKKGSFVYVPRYKQRLAVHKVDRAAREVTIRELQLLEYSGERCRLRVSCSKGT